MTSTYPTSKDNFVNPQGTDYRNAPSLAGQMTDKNTAIEALETKVGIDNDTNVDSIDYQLSGVASGDIAVSVTGTQTLTNKTLTSPVIASIKPDASHTLTLPAVTDTVVVQTSPAITTPKITTSINDANGNEVIKTPATASAVNEITVTNAIAGQPVQVTATGNDADIGLTIQGKGNGVVKLGKIPLAIPNTDGTAGQVVVTNGLGTLSFSDIVASGSAGDHFGDGRDGNVVISVDTTLTSDKYYDALTINNGITLNCAGYVVYAKQKIINNGTIQNNGAVGGNGTGTTGGTGGAGGTGHTLTAGVSGGSGGNQGNNPGGAGGAGAAKNPSLGSSGVGGGAGGFGNGSSANGGTAGGAGTATAETLAYSATFVASVSLTAGAEATNTELYKLLGSSSALALSSSAGSGGGGGGAFGSGGGGGGGGGGAGGVLFLASPIITNNGTIQTNGGIGGNGANGGGSSAGGGGGGGGGSGGVICLIYRTLTAGTIQALVGTGGAGGTKSDLNGQDGFAGNTGNAGKIYKMKVGETYIA